MPANDDVIRRNNVKITGSGQQVMLMAHGFGCNQLMWRFLTPELSSQYKIVLFDYVGSGGSNLAAYSRQKYADLEGYAQDIIDICTRLDLQNVVLVGQPNVGKSSLLNALAGEERAIVTEIAGTTRDTLEEVINLRGLPLRLIDTAGLRESDDVLERAGIERSHAALAGAGLVLEVADGSQPKSQPTTVTNPGTNTPHLLVLNKADLGEDPSWHGTAAIRVSCSSGEGMEALAAAIESLLTGGAVTWNADLVSINARHQACLQEARTALDAARDLLVTSQPPELAAEELRAAMQAIGTVVGQTNPEELLGLIFGQFCIGK